MRIRTRRSFISLLRLISVCALTSSRVLAADDYSLGPDSMEHNGVPRGEMTHAAWTSKIFPGTVRDYWVYVPKQYDASRPACVMVFQDGGGYQDRNGGFRVPVVFDNLIHKKEMPVTIAIMINPGVVPASNPSALPRFNRSFEYDSPSDQYARFLMEEILPEVGRKYNLSKDPNDRAISGASSGGICAFTAAWERPDQFRRVVSFIGSFTNLRGGHVYPAMIRKTEPKPLRVFLQDGTNDQDIYSGHWFIGNEDVAAALKYAKYEVQFVVGDGGHSGRHGSAILPDALRWVWKDYPKPVTANTTTPQPVMTVLTPTDVWQRVAPGMTTVTALATDATGRVFAADKTNGVLWGSGTGDMRAFSIAGTGTVSSLAFGPDGLLYGSQPDKKRIVSWNLATASAPRVVATGIRASSIVIDNRGRLYAAEPSTGKVWLIDKGARPRVVDTASVGAEYISLSPDQTLLFLSPSPSEKFALSYQIQANGSLTNKQPYFDLHTAYDQTSTGAGGMTSDTNGWLYAAARMGIQLWDQASRVNGIILNPEGRSVTQLMFGGPELDTLYAIADGRLYRRKTRAKGVLPFQTPVKPPPPRL